MPSIINSDDGVVSGSSGLKTTGGNDGILALQNNGTTNVTVTAAGNSGFGTTSPAQLVHLRKDQNGTTALLVQNRNSTGSPVSAIQFITGLFDLSDDRYAMISSDGGGSSTLKFSTSNGAAPVTHAAITATGLFQFNSGYGSVATAYGCRAWVNFNGTGVVAIRGSGNVSSITDVTTGTYNVNFTAALTDANYSAVGCAGGADPNNGDRQLSTYPTSSSVCRVVSGVTASVTKYDADQVMVAIFR